MLSRVHSDVVVSRFSSKRYRNRADNTRSLPTALLPDSLYTMMFSTRFSALAATSLLLAAASAASEGFLCPVPVIPSTFGPSNACCSKLVKIPLSELVNPEDGAVYYGFNCTCGLGG